MELHVGLYNSIYSLPVPIKPWAPLGQCITSLITTFAPVGTQFVLESHIELSLTDVVNDNEVNWSEKLNVFEEAETHPPIVAITV